MRRSREKMFFKHKNNILSYMNGTLRAKNLNAFQ